MRGTLGAAATAAMVRQGGCGLTHGRVGTEGGGLFLFCFRDSLVLQLSESMSTYVSFKQLFGSLGKVGGQKHVQSFASVLVHSTCARLFSYLLFY